jgi:hypothetical protein
MVRSKEFRLEDVVVLHEDGRPVVRVEFSYDPVETDNNPVRDGWVVLDPERYWLIQRGEVQAQWARGTEVGTITFNNRFTSLDGNLPIPELAEVHVRADIADGSRTDHLWVSEFTAFEKVELREEDFRLTAFGIAEPVRPENVAPSRWKVAILLGNLVALVCLGGWVLLRWILRRRPRPGAGP